MWLSTYNNRYIQNAMSETEHNLYGEWNDDDPITKIDKWLESDTWIEICHDADNGDEDSLDLMDQFNEMLGSLTWHVGNDSGMKRVGYEFKQILNLIENFN